jgi:hypothetical protein
VKSFLFVRDRGLLVRGVVKTVFDGVFSFIPRECVVYWYSIQ